MRELLNDHSYELIAGYENCIIDYCLIEDEIPHQGKRSHKEAVLFAMLKVIERYINTQIKAEIKYCRKVEDEPFLWHLDIGKAQAHQIDASTLLHIPTILHSDDVGQRFYDCGIPVPLKGEQIPYWNAFWEMPHTSGMGSMILSKSIPFCSRGEQKNSKYMNGQPIGQTILTEVTNGGVLLAGVFMIST